MITIEIGNSYSRVIGLSPSAEKSLREELSYTVGASAAFFSGNHRPRRKTLLDRRGAFPTGLLPRVEGYLKKLNVGAYRRLDARTVPTIGSADLRGDFGSTVPYPDQVGAVGAVVRSGQGCVSMPTGTGKSLVVALLIDRLRVRTLVVVPTLEIKKQMTESLEAIFCKNSCIRVENIGSSSLKNAKDFDLLVIDEAHHSASKTYQTLNKTAWAGIYYRLYLTATPFRNQTEETLLYEGIAGPVRYALSYSDAVKGGYIVPVEGYYLEAPKQPTDAYTYAEVYRELVVRNEARNGLIARLITSLNESNKAALCLVKEIEHGETLAAMTGLPFANGQDEATRGYIDAFNSGEIKVLIGTTGILGEGVDTKPCEFVVVAGLGKAKSAFQQQIGRAVRRYGDKESAKVIIVRDASHKFTLRHFNAQKKILLEEYQVRVEKITI